MQFLNSFKMVNKKCNICGESFISKRLIQSNKSMCEKCSSKKIIYADGSGWNGYSSAYCIYIQNKNKKIIKVFYEPKSSFEMELSALEYAINLSKEKTVIFSDSIPAINSIKYGKRPNLLNLVLKKSLTISWIPRERNIAGIILQRRLGKLRTYANNCSKMHYR